MVYPQRVNRRSSSSRKSSTRSRQRSIRQRSIRQRGLGLEALEPREMLAADVVISEVMYNVAGSDTGKEYVELYNAGDASIDLGGWRLEDDGGNRLYTLPSRTLQAGNYLLIASGTNNFASVPNKVGNSGGWTTGGLGNNGDSVILENSSGIEQARLDYETSDPWPERADKGNSSLQILNRDEIAEDRYRQSNWIASREVDGSPGVAGFTTAGEVAINEILGNSGVGVSDEVELYNLTDKEVNISGWVFLKGDFGDNDVSGAIPNGTVIPPRGFISFDENDLSNLRLSSTGEVISLLNNTRTLFIDAVDYRPAEEGVSLGRLPNGTGDFFPGASPSFGQANVDHRLTPLVISEIMYHPLREGNQAENRDLEFLEIQNRSGGSTVNTPAGKWRLRQDLDFDFPAFSLSPGGRLLVVPFALTDTAKVNAFNAHYGVTLANLNVVGGYGAGIAGDNLSNRRAVIELRELVDVGSLTDEWVTRDLVAYEDRDGWSPRADGLGSSLERIDPNGYGNDADNWRGSNDFKGSPGVAGTSQQDVVINEVLAHTDPPFKDTIELYNTTGASIDIGGWYLTDDFALLDRYQIPSGTILPANQYFAVDSDDLGFNIDAAKGEELWLTEVSGGVPVRFADNVSFSASFNPESFGRWPNGSGELFPMSDRTLGASEQTYSNGANSGPIIADLAAPDTNSFSAKVIISEIMYNAGSSGSSDDQIGLDNFEYVELYNRTDLAISLGQREDNIADDGEPWVRTPQGWRLNTAVDFEFPCVEGDPACEIEPFGTVLVVGFDPIAEPAVLNAFRARYGLGSSVKIFGPFEGDDVLSDKGEVLELEAPDGAPGGISSADAFTPNILVDRVSYQSNSPWPTQAAGSGMSLTRTAPNAFGDFASSWTAATPSPGSVSGFEGPRVVDVIASGSTWNAQFLNEISSPGAARQGYSFANASSQSTPLPWALVDEISIVFDSDVEIQSRALSIRGVNVADYAVGTNATYDAAAFTATWKINAGSISADRVILDLDDDKVTDASTSVHLDGEWTDDSGAAQSGDSSPGGDFLFRLNVFGGDVDRDGDVQSDDFTAVLGAMFSSVGDASYSAETDTDGSGQVTVLDWVKTRRRLGSSLPSGTANSPQAPASLRTAVIRSESTSSSQDDNRAAVARLDRSGLRSIATRMLATQAMATQAMATGAIATPAIGSAVRRSSALSQRATEVEIHQAVDRVHATSTDVLQSQRASRAALRHRLSVRLASNQGARAESLSNGFADGDRF